MQVFEHRLCCDCMNAGGLVAELTDKDQIKKGNFIMTRRLYRGRGSNPAWLLVGAAFLCSWISNPADFASGANRR